MTSIISTSAAMSSFRGFMRSTPGPGPPHPHQDAAHHYAEWQERLADPDDHFHFAAAQHHAAVVFGLGPDRNHVLVGSEPVDAVHGQVGIADGVDIAVAYPVGRADNDEAPRSILFAGLVFSGRSDCKWTPLVVGVLQIRRTQVHDCEG